MNYITVNVKVIKSKQERIYVPSFLIKKLNLKNNQKLTIYFGLTKKRTVLLNSFNSQKDEVIITSSLKEGLALPFRKNIMLKKELDGLRFGPIIGIITTDLTGNKFSNPATSAYHPHSIFFKSLLKPEDYHPAYYFVFTPENVDWATKTVRGFFLKKNNNNIKTWHSYRVPFPDVVYNRIPNRTLEKRDLVKKFKYEYLIMGGKIFNQDFYNKWNMYLILKDDSSCNKFIPETLINPSLDDFINMADRHSILYLKPANGSLGLGIFKIVKTGKLFTVKHRLGSKNVNYNFNSINSVYKYIFSRKKTINYLLQQGIDLIDYEKNPVDFRVQLHKNHQNQWLVTAIGAKAAGQNSVTTHLRTGGKVIDSEEFLANRFGYESIDLINKVKSSAIKIAASVEKHNNSPIGELGLDIGIDNNKNIWLFEVNSKPGRSIFKHPSLKPALFKSNFLLLQYATYLAGFNNDKDIKEEII